MRLVCKTSVPYQFSFVKDQFDQQYHRFISNRLSNLIQVNSNHKSDLGERISFRLLGANQAVESEYVSVYENENEISLVSEFIKLPYGIQNMRHYQKVRITDYDTCKIFEEISFSTTKKWLKVLYKPLILRLLRRRLNHAKYFLEHARDQERRTSNSNQKRENYQPGYPLPFKTKIGAADSVLSRV